MSKIPVATNALSMLALLLGCAAPLRAQSTSPDSATPSAWIATFSYSGELVGDVAGGARRDATYLGAAAAQLKVDLNKLAHWRGATVFAYLIGTHGGSPSGSVGDVQGVSSLEAPTSVRLEELWIQQNVIDNRLSLLAGRYDLNSEFYRLQSAALFVNSSFGIGPEFSQSGIAGPSIFPATSIGSRVAFKSSPNVVWRAAVLDGVPVDRAGGSVGAFARGDGALVVGELAVLERPDSARMTRDPRFFVGRGRVLPYTGKLAVGAWYYTSSFPDLVDTLATGAPLMHGGSRGVYALGDRTIWSGAGSSARSLDAFVQLGLGDSRVDQIGGYIGAGLAFTAPIASRPNDQLGLAIAAARNGSHFERAELALDARARSESTIELTYLAQLTAWLALQPDVQYVINPGGTSSARNALVPGLRIALSH